MDTNRFTGSDLVPSAVTIDQNIVLKILLKNIPSIFLTMHAALIRIIESEHNVVSAAADNIFHLIHMIMHRRNLPAVAHHDFLGIRLRIFRIMNISISNRNQRKSELIEVTLSIISHIPAQLIIPDFIVLMVLRLPFIRRKAEIRRKTESALLKQSLEFSDRSIDFRTFHPFILSLLCNISDHPG